MAKYIDKYYKGNDIYNDGSAEEILLNYYKCGGLLDDKDDNIFYLTTNIRKNILNWYPFDKNASLLEIGSGCGPLTDMFCDKCKDVTAIEGSDRRAKITYYKCKDKENLVVYSGNFQDIKLKNKYDYIVLIGVFEYAKRFFENDNPFKFFLKKIKKLLKPNGIILLAIENRYGIKYFAGANEDHLGIPYVGFIDYDKTDIQTFGKKELIDMAHDIGLNKYKFYYPFPDYKLPSVIFTDERQPKKGENIPMYTYGNIINYDIKKAYKGIIENGNFGFFSNSFLIELGNDNCLLSNIDYANIQSYRKDEYRIITRQKNNKIYKICDDKKSSIHLKNMKNIYNMLNKNTKLFLPYKYENGYISADIIKGQNVIEIINDLLSHNDILGIAKEIENIIDYLSKFTIIKNNNNFLNKLFNIAYPEPKKCKILKLGLLDFNGTNILKLNKKYLAIDQEWITDKDIPLDYSIYNTINYIYTDVPALNDILPKSNYYKKYNFNIDKINAFNSVYEEFFIKNNIIEKEKHVKIDNMGKYNCISGGKCDIIVSNANIYFDIGNGYNENNKITVPYEINDNIYSVKFVIPDKTKILRLDPCEMGLSLVKYKNVKCNGKVVEYKENNIYTTKNGDKLLIRKNPYLEFKYIDSNNIVLEIEMLKLKSDEVIEIINSEIE